MFLFIYSKFNFQIWSRCPCALAPTSWSIHVFHSKLNKLKIKSFHCGQGKFIAVQKNELKWVPQVACLTRLVLSSRCQRLNHTWFQTLLSCKRLTELREEFCWWTWASMLRSLSSIITIWKWVTRSSKWVLSMNWFILKCIFITTF